MTFAQTLIITLLDKAVIAGLLVVAGFWINRSIERLKHQLEFRRQLGSARDASYRSLWALTWIVSPTDQRELKEERRHQLELDLRSWYYTDGGGVYLSKNAAKLFLAAKASLTNPTIDAAKIREAFSAVRTQLKVDVGAYDDKDAKTQIAPQLNTT